MRATSGRPMLAMYSFLSRTSLMVNEITSSPILFMSSAQVERIRSATISGCFTISSTVSCPMMPRRWPSITSRIKASRSCGGLVRNCSDAVNTDSGSDFTLICATESVLTASEQFQHRFRVGLHFDLRHGFYRDGNALLGVEVLLRRHVEGHQLQR